MKVAKNLQATLLFVDFTKAFDSIHRGKMEQILLAYGLPKETVAYIHIETVRNIVFLLFGLIIQFKGENFRQISIRIFSAFGKFLDVIFKF